MLNSELRKVGSRTLYVTMSLLLHILNFAATGSKWRPMDRLYVTISGLKRIIPAWQN